MCRRFNHHKHGGRELPSHLPRVEIPHDLTEEQKKCPCFGNSREKIGEESSWQSEYVPGHFELIEHV